jgi:hypothetical protein
VLLLATKTLEHREEEKHQKGEDGRGEASGRVFSVPTGLIVTPVIISTQKRRQKKRRKMTLRRGDTEGTMQLNNKG